MISVDNYRKYTDATASASSSTTKSSSKQDTSETFMGLLLAQLTNQNPLEPMNDTEMVGQMLSMNSLQELQKISKAITAMSEANQFLSATNLIDKTVSYLDKNDKEQTGKVSGVTTADSKVYLTIGDASVEIARLIKVTTAQAESKSDASTKSTSETEAA